MRRANPFDVGNQSAQWGSGVVVAINFPENRPVLLTVELRQWGLFDFSLSTFLSGVVVSGEDPVALLGKRVVFRAFPKNDHPTALIVVLNVVDPIHEIVLRTTEVVRSPLTSEADPVPCGEVILAPHALMRSREREIIVPREDILRIGRLSVSYLKRDIPFFLAVARHRYSAAISVFPRVIKTVMPYNKDYLNIARQRTSDAIEYI